MEMEYKGHKITVTHELKFRVTGPEFDEKAYRGSYEFASKDEASRSIDARVASAEKQKAAENSVKIAALYGYTGELFVVRGINRANSEILGCPKQDHYGRHPYDIYPDVPWVKELLEERRRLTARVTEIVDKLNPYGMANRAGYSGRVKPESYDGTLKKFVDELQANIAAAIAAAPAPKAGEE